MIVSLKNDCLEVRVNTLGACLVGITYLQTGEELMFGGNPDYWNYSDHVMFPFVARLNGGWYTVNGVKYESDIHGFAKDSEFVVTALDEKCVTLALSANEFTKKSYPFDFALSVTYRLEKNGFSCKMTVKNDGKEEMPFYIGTHPSFVLDDDCDDYLELAPGEYFGHNLKGKFLIPAEKVGYYATVKPDKAFFKKYNTLILLRNGSVTKVKRKNYVISVKSDSPVIAFWADDERDNYVCVENWWGIPDYADEPVREFSQKTYVNKLAAGKEKDFCYSVNVIRSEE